MDSSAVVGGGISSSSEFGDEDNMVRHDEG